MFSVGFWGGSPLFDITDWYDEYFHALWVADDGLDGSGDWIDRVNGYAAAATNSPSASTFNGHLAWDLNGTNQYFNCTDVIGDIVGYVAVARHNGSVFTDYDGIIGPTSGGQTGLIGQDGSTRMWRVGSIGDGVGWDGGFTDNQTNGFLPCTEKLRGILIQKQYLTGVNLSNGVIIGRDRGTNTRCWDGQIAIAGILKKALPTDLWYSILGTWANEYGFMSTIKDNCFWKNRQPKVQSNRNGRNLLREGAHQYFRSVRTRERSSGFRGMPEVGVNYPDCMSSNGIQYLLPCGSIQSHVSMDLTTWTPSGGVGIPEPLGDDAYSVSVNGEGFLTYDLASDFSGNKSGRCLVRTVEGELPTGSIFTFYNNDIKVGSGGVMDGLGQNDWDLVDVVQAGTNDQMRFYFPPDTNCTVWIRKVRMQLNFLTPFPAPYNGTAVGTGSGTDSAYIASFNSPSAATIGFLFKPYGGWYGGGTGPESPPAGDGTRIFSIGSWHLRGAEDPVLSVASVDSITASGSNIVNDWQVWWFDYNGTEVGLQCGYESTRHTYATTEVPGGSLYVGNQSAVNQLHGFIAVFVFDRVVSQTDRISMENEMIRTAKASNIKEQ